MTIDLRSDTVTKPTPAMLEFMASAPIGDDVLGEDPTTKHLEHEAARLFEKEAAVFLPTGTMANLCALITHAARGTRVVCGTESHVFQYEAGGASALGGLAYHPVANAADGGLEPLALADALATHRAAAEDSHLAPVGVVAFEVTQNRCGGTVPAIFGLEAASASARALGVPVHVDGARIFNAHIASGVPLSRYGALADSLQFCLSKGLSAPAGSLLLGNRELVRGARRARKMLGGGMRQSGVLAAAGVVALATGIPRLADDHAMARALATTLESVLDGSLEVRSPQTNIVFFRARAGSRSNTDVVALFRERGILVGGMGAWIRAVTHADLAPSTVEEVASRLRSAR